jgi:hypothetical protein
MAKKFLFSGSDNSYLGKCLELGEASDEDFNEIFSKYQMRYFPEKPDFNDGDKVYKYFVIQILEIEKGKYVNFQKPGFYQII